MELIKLHLCCGEVYLKNYHNLDLNIPGYSFLAEERPDIKNINQTTVEKYYQYPLGQNPIKKCIADKFVDVRNLSEHYQENSADYALMLSSFEHFTKKEAESILNQLKIILKPKCKFHFNFPDLEKSLALIDTERTISSADWAIRLIYGSYKNEYSTHKWGYTIETIKHFIKPYFNNIIEEEIVKTDYPVIGVTVWND